jgi:endonuclease/exonuclease/phosphatase family metal-dependent hydrolase
VGAALALRPSVSRALIAAVLVCAPLACGPGHEPPPAAGTSVRPAAVVRVATWNVHDLFDETDRLVPPGARDEVPDGDAVEAKLSRLAAVLARLDADVVLLQEVENRAVLERLAARAAYPEARLVEGDDPRGIDVAALSRLPLEAYVSHLGERDAAGRPLFPRDCVEIHARAAARPVVVVGSHFSSALSDDGTRREAQAARLREIADEVRAVRPSALVVAGGDLNDGPASLPLAPLLADGAWIDPTGPGEITWVGASGGAHLVHLLLPREDAHALLAARVEAGADVAAASDHRPVVIDLRLD